MAKVMMDLPIEGIEEILVQLPPQQLAAIFAHLQNRLESFQMMKLAESSFSEWVTEADIYSSNG